MKHQATGAFFIASLVLAAGCRDILGFQDPMLISTGGTGGAGGTGGGGCMSPADCPPLDSECQLATCESGACAVENAPPGTPVATQTPGDCKKTVCDGAGNQQEDDDDADSKDDGNECTFDVCNAGTPGTVTKDEGTPCTGGYCNAAAMCVECTEPEHCVSFVCLPDGTCKQPSCDDNVQNGDEKGVDCGGSTCPDCGDCMNVVACPIWAKSFGDSKDQQVRSLAVDIGGKLLVTGDVAGITDFGGIQLTSAGGPDIFVAKLDTAGGVQWTKSFGDINLQYGRNVTTDLFGNVIVTGETSGTVDFGGGALTAQSYDVYVVKLDPNGGHLWSKLFGDGAIQRAISAAIDTDNNLILAGGFEGSIDFGGGALSAVGFEDTFIAKLDPDGNEIWSLRFGESGDQRALAVATDLQQNIYVTGWFEGSIDFGMGAITSAGGEDGFLVKLGPAGNVLWAKTFGDVVDQRPAAVTVDASGNPLIAGYFYGSMAVPGGPTLTSAGDQDVFLVKLNTLGNHQFSKSFGTAGNQAATGIVGDQTGDLVLTGNFTGTIDFGGGALISAGSTDIFVTKLTSDGAHKWSLRYGDMAIQSFVTAGTNSMNQIFLASTFAGTVELGLGPMASAGGTDILLGKLGP